MFLRVSHDRSDVDVGFRAKYFGLVSDVLRSAPSLFEVGVVIVSLWEIAY